MGKPQFLRRSLTLLAFGVAMVLFTGCGGDEPFPLESSDVEDIYSGGVGGTKYFVTSTNPADFGTITGKVNYTGRRRNRKVPLAKDFCINANPNGMLSENFMVGANGELGNVIVYVKFGLKKVSFPTPTESVLLDQKACQYLPHLVVVQFGQELIIRNSDNHEHNVHWMPGVNGEINEPMNTPFDLDPMTFSRTQVAASVKCEIHGWMQSYVAVLAHPCWAITKDDGTFEIKGVPPGNLQLAAWHEELGEIPIDFTLAKSESKAQDFTFPVPK